MSSNEQSVTMLRQNKRSLVAALNSAGFNLPENARAADFPKYVKWAYGLLDLTIAANRRRDGKKFYFTLEEWRSLSATEQELFLLRGIRVRANGQSFVIAPDTLGPVAFGPEISTTGFQQFSNPGTMSVYQFYDAYNTTAAIANAYANASLEGVAGAPAAELALAYKAFTLEGDELEDDSKWCLPTIAHCKIIDQNMAKIEELFSAVWSAAFTFRREVHWTCCKSTSAYTYHYSPNANAYSYQTPTRLSYVRPICLEDEQL